MLIALGEKIVNANDSNSQFLSTDYAENLPDGFSFTGYRLIPVLLAWWTAPILFGIFLLLTQSSILAALLDCLYIFNNAFIVHFRGAMLDGILFFFISLALLSFLLTLKWKTGTLCIASSLLLGVALGGAVTTKAMGLILLLLLPATFIGILPHWRKAITALGLTSISFCLTFVAVWQIHFALISQMNPELPNKGYYEISSEYREILAEGQNRSLFSFPVMFRDAINYGTNYHQNVDELNLCDPDATGSPPLYWLVGAKAINYRWETPNGEDYRYLYLQSNPVIWGAGLLGVILSSAFFLTSLFLPVGNLFKNRFLLIVFLTLYWGYMIAISSIDRAMYLYHYFPPLLFSFCLFGLVVKEIPALGQWKLNERRRTLIVLFCITLILIAYWFYSPLTYYRPLTDAELERRAILPLWKLECVNCEN
jgi:dolichyl-phosphate-mannose-protein mannosyltransferase